MASLEHLRGQAFAYTYMYAGSLVGYNTGSVSDCSAKAMTYTYLNNYKAFSLRDPITGRLYSYNYYLINYTRGENGLEGLIGWTSSDGSVSGVS
jgi:hypothetical protein